MASLKQVIPKRGKSSRLAAGQRGSGIGVSFRMPRRVTWRSKRANHPVLGYLVWAVLIGAVFAGEGLALSHISGSVPTLSATFRAIMRYPPGRWALFALWLWLGWHLFVRGWHFLLQA